MAEEPLEGQMALFESPQEKPGKAKVARERKTSPREATKVDAKSAARKKVANAATGKGKKRRQKPSRGLSGLVPEGDVRLTANIREDLHLKLKIAAARQRTTIGELIEQMVEKYIK